MSEGTDTASYDIMEAEKTNAKKACSSRNLSGPIHDNRQEEEQFPFSEAVPFDERPNMRANIEDMRPSLISDYLHTVGSDLYQDSLVRPLRDVAADMRLIGGTSEVQKPINAGLMFFSDDPEHYFREARIELVNKPDPTGNGMTEKVFTGPLDRQLRDALSYIKNYVVQEKLVKIPGRAEAERIYNYPYDAVKEALSNAVYHKSYQICEPVTVTVTPDRMEITSLPGPDRMISDEDIANRKMVSPEYRNPRIGDFLKALHLVEGRNTGIPAILQSMEQNGSDLPVFETEADRTYLTVILPVQKHFLISPA